tara:strand:+ start:308 stop:463 length:156 start_codon:yes stop_codon:yes gene_type:complete
MDRYQHIQEEKERKYQERVSNIEKEIENKKMKLRMTLKNNIDKDDPLIVSK